MLLFMGFPSVKDPSFAERFPGKSTCEIISTAHPEWFERFLEERTDGTRNPNQSGKRANVDYAAIKQAASEHEPACRPRPSSVDLCATACQPRPLITRPCLQGLEEKLSAAVNAAIDCGQFACKRRSMNSRPSPLRRVRTRLV